MINDLYQLIKLNQCGRGGSGDAAIPRRAGLLCAGGDRRLERGRKHRAVSATIACSSSAMTILPLIGCTTFGMIDAS